MPEQKVERIRKTRKKEYFQSAEARKNIKKKKNQRGKERREKKKKKLIFSMIEKKGKKMIHRGFNVFECKGEAIAMKKREKTKKKYIYIEAKCVAT